MAVAVAAPGDGAAPPPAPAPAPSPGVHSVTVCCAAGADSGGVSRFAVAFSVGASLQQVVHRRYRSFDKLRAELGPFAAALAAPFPPKSLWLRAGDDAFERRRAGLEAWMRELAGRAGAYWPRADDDRLRALQKREAALGADERAELAVLRPRNEHFIEQGVEVMRLAAALGGAADVDPSDASARLRRFLGVLPGWEDPDPESPTSRAEQKLSRDRTGFGAPGMYVTVQDVTFVEEEVQRGSRRVTKLARGTEVEVTEVVRRDDMKRLRGRITDPAGWISLQSLQDGSRWVATAGQDAAPAVPAVI